jgi:hypothetical protein
MACYEDSFFFTFISIPTLYRFIFCDLISSFVFPGEFQDVFKNLVRRWNCPVSQALFSSNSTCRSSVSFPVTSNHKYIRHMSDFAPAIVLKNISICRHVATSAAEYTAGVPVLVWQLTSSRVGVPWSACNEISVVTYSPKEMLTN